MGYAWSIADNYANGRGHDLLFIAINRSLARSALLRKSSLQEGTYSGRSASIQLRLDARLRERLGLETLALNIKQKLHHIPFRYHILLALAAQPAAVAGFGQGAGFEQLGVAHGLGADKAALEIRVDDAGGLGAVMPAWIVQARVSFSPVVK